MSKSMTITLLGLTLVATNAFAQYADHPVLLGQSWGPDAQLFAGQSVSEKTARQATRENTASVGESVAPKGPSGPSMEDFFRWNDLGYL